MSFTLMSFQLNQDLKRFNWNKSGEKGTLATFIFLMLMSENSICWVPLNHDKTKFRTKLTCLLRVNWEISRIPPSIMLLVLSFSV